MYGGVDYLTLSPSGNITLNNIIASAPLSAASTFNKTRIVWRRTEIYETTRLSFTYLSCHPKSGHRPASAMAYYMHRDVTERSRTSTGQCAVHTPITNAIKKLTERQPRGAANSCKHVVMCARGLCVCGGSASYLRFATLLLMEQGVGMAAHRGVQNDIRISKEKHVSLLSCVHSDSSSYVTNQIDLLATTTS